MAGERFRPRAQQLFRDFDHDGSGLLDGNGFQLLVTELAQQEGLQKADDWMKLHVGSYVGSI